MSRVTLSSLVETTMVRSGVSQVLVLAGATIQPKLHGTATNATIYSAETGATTITNPQTTTASGDVSGWLAEGRYDIVVTHPSGAPTKTIIAQATGGGNYDRDNGQAGMYAMGPLGTTSALAAPTANRAFLHRFVPSRDMTIGSIAYDVGVAASANDAIDVGIYDATLNRLASAGATLGKLNAAGRQVVTLTASVTLRAGVVYYAAWSSGTAGGTAVTIRTLSYGTTFTAGLFGASAPQAEALQAAASHPLPTTITGPSGSSNLPLLAVLEA